MIRPIPLLLALLSIAIPLSLLAGRVWLDPWVTPNAAVILGELRLPRALLAVTIGGGLGAAGAAMQGYLRNPLADPGLFGIAPAAALGAVLSLLPGYAASAWLLPLFALAGAAGAMLLLALIAGRAGGIALFTLAGMMIASLAGALTRPRHQPRAQRLRDERDRRLADGCADRPRLARPMAGPAADQCRGIVLLRLAGHGLDALTLGEAAARSLGVSPGKLQALLVVGVGLTVGSGVAIAGVIGFVGLMVPHLVRPFTDRRPSSLIVPSALAGCSACAGGRLRVPRPAAGDRASGSASPST